MSSITFASLSTMHFLGSSTLDSNLLNFVTNFSGKSFTLLSSSIVSNNFADWVNLRYDLNLPLSLYNFLDLFLSSERSGKKVLKRLFDIFRYQLLVCYLNTFIIPFVIWIDASHYLLLIIYIVYFLCSFFLKEKRAVPHRGLEPRSTRWKRVILTPRLMRNTLIIINFHYRYHTFFPMYWFCWLYITSRLWKLS